MKISEIPQSAINKLSWTVQKNQCWIADGNPSKSNGYKMICYRVLVKGRKVPKMIYGHRLAYLIANKVLPNKYHVLHTCDTPMCVNPKHLVLGTQKDNMKDMWQKKRWRKCELTREQILEIYNDPRPTLDVAQDYNVSCNTVVRIKAKKGHRDVTQNEPPKQKNKLNLTDEQIKEIYTSTVPPKKLAKQLHISPKTIYGIRSAHIKPELTQGLVRHDFCRRRLNDAEIKEIFFSNEPLKIVAAKYKIDISTVSAIRNRKVYAKITADLVKAQTSVRGDAFFSKNPDAVVEIYLSHQSATYMAEKYKCTQTLIASIRSGDSYRKLTKGLERVKRKRGPKSF